MFGRSFTLLDCFYQSWTSFSLTPNLRPTTEFDFSIKSTTFNFIEDTNTYFKIGIMLRIFVVLEACWSLYTIKMRFITKYIKHLMCPLTSNELIGPFLDAYGGLVLVYPTDDFALFFLLSCLNSNCAWFPRLILIRVVLYSIHYCNTSQANPSNWLDSKNWWLLPVVSHNVQCIFCFTRITITHKTHYSRVEVAILVSSTVAQHEKN